MHTRPVLAGGLFAGLTPSQLSSRNSYFLRSGLCCGSSPSRPGWLREGLGSLSFLRTGFKGRFLAWLLVLRASSCVWGGHCGFSVFCCFMFSVLTGSGSWAGAVGAAGGWCCWAHRPPALLLPQHTRNPTGKEQEGACKGAGPLLPLHKQKIRRGLQEGALY